PARRTIPVGTRRRSSAYVAPRTVERQPWLVVMVLHFSRRRARAIRRRRWTEDRPAHRVHAAHLPRHGTPLLGGERVAAGRSELGQLCRDHLALPLARDVGGGEDVGDDVVHHV